MTIAYDYLNTPLENSNILGLGSFFRIELLNTGRGAMTDVFASVTLSLSGSLRQSFPSALRARQACLCL